MSNGTRFTITRRTSLHSCAVNFRSFSWVPRTKIATILKEKGQTIINHVLFACSIVFGFDIRLNTLRISSTCQIPEGECEVSYYKVNKNKRNGRT